MNIRVAGGLCLGIAAALAAPVSAATPPVDPGGPNIPAPTATLSTPKAGARPVALTVTVHYEMVCGQPGRGSVVVAFPRAAFVPASIDRGAVLVNGKTAPAVSVSGHGVSIAMPLPHGVTCMSIGPGALALTFTRAAGVGNPPRPGVYTILVHRNAQTFEARVRIIA